MTEKQFLGRLEGSQNVAFVDWEAECRALRAQVAALREALEEARSLIARQATDRADRGSDSPGLPWVADAYLVIDAALERELHAKDQQRS